MSLKSQPEYKASPEFEPMDDAATMTETTTSEETMNTTTQDQAAAGVAAATAIAKAATTAVGAPAPKFAVAFADKNNVFDTSTVEGLALAAPALKGEQGSVFKGEKDLGSEIHLEMISFNHRWVIGTGEQDAEAKEFFKISYDKETLSGDGTSVQAYVESLKAQGFSKTKVSPYLDIWGFLVWSEKEGDVDVEQREIVRLQCSQTSLGAFTAFATTRGLLESKGVAKPIDVIGVRAMKRVSGSNKFTNFEFFAPKAK